MDIVSTLIPRIRKFGSLLSNRYLNPSFIRFTAVTIIFFGILNLIVVLYTSSGGLNVYGSWVGGDYPCFYIAGKMLNEYPSEKLYDFRLHSEILHTLLPEISSNEQIPYINPPFFALIFMPLARLPYMVSYLAWIFISVLLYVMAFKLVWKTLDSLPADLSNTALLLALSFEPFIMENILGGNCSAVGFLALAMYLYFDYLKKDILAGFSLGILLYKPTFLIMILPMLLVARRFKIIIGFGICGLFTIFLSIMTVGLETSVEYMRFLFGFSTIRFGSDTAMRLWKYVDIFSFYRQLFGTISPTVRVLITMASLLPVIFSIKLWWKMKRLDESSREVVKASAITLTIIINLHFGIYDCVFIVLAALLTLNAFYRNSLMLETSDLSSGFNALLVTIYILPWISQHIAQLIGFQLVTIAVAIMGIYQIVVAHIISRDYLQVKIN